MGFLDFLSDMAVSVFNGLENKTKQLPEYKIAYNEGMRLRPEEICRRIHCCDDGPEKYGYHDALQNKSVSSSDAKRLCNKYSDYMIQDALKNKF